MKRFLILALAVLVVAGLAFTDRETDPRLAALKLCTPKPSKFDRGTMIASKVGSIVPAMNKPLPYDAMAETARGAWHTVGYWVGVMGAAMDGRPTPVAAPEPVDCSTVLNACLALGGGHPATVASSRSSLTGAALAADALRAAGFPADEIPTFVAIAEHESGSAPTAAAPTVRRRHMPACGNSRPVLEARRLGRSVRECSDGEAGPRRVRERGDSARIRGLRGGLRFGTPANTRR